MYLGVLPSSHVYVIAPRNVDESVAPGEEEGWVAPR